MPPDVTVAVLLGAAAGLAYAHAAKDSRGRELGIVHRDVSPQNIFLTRDGSVKVIDFGIALSSARAQTTLHGVVKGKVAYMAPEQMRGLGADVRSDVWSLGVVAWELLTGKRLFRREADVVEAVLHGEIPPPSAIGAATDAELDAIVLSMLERDLMRRTPTCAAVHDALLRWSRDKRIPTPHELAAWLARVLEPERDAAPAPSAEATRTIRLSSAMAGGADARPREGASTATVGPPRASAREQTATVDPPARRAASSVAAPTREQTATVDPRARRPAATIGSPDAEDTATVDAPAPSPAGAPKVAARSRGRSARLAVASAVALAFGAVVVVGALVGAGALGSSSAGGDPEARVVPAVAPEPVVPRTVRFTVEGLPEGATVWLDGVAVAGSVAELAEGGSTHVLEVRDARGEVLLSRELVADANVRIPLIELPRAEAPSAAAADVPRPTPRRPRRPSRGSTLRARDRSELPLTAHGAGHSSGHVTSPSTYAGSLSSSTRTETQDATPDASAWHVVAPVHSTPAHAAIRSMQSTRTSPATNRTRACFSTTGRAVGARRG
ncbi:MAG: serine/threonine protein kinase [Sandaracinaceae bacterium]|nr:serine/threonine protein kinase [Sandaracinaceae bacterium]